MATTRQRMTQSGAVLLDLRGRTILIAEDVRFTRLTLAKILSELGQPAVLEAGDGAAALTLLQQHNGGIDCVITDLDMPKLDGLGLLQAVRAGTTAAPRNTKIVLLTGHSDIDRLGPAFLLDPDAFLAKPVSRQALESCLQRLFAPQPGVAGTPAPSAQCSVQSPPPVTSAPLSHGECLLALSEISADAELARDLLLSNGRLLLPAGARLNQRTRILLMELLPMAGLPPSVWIRMPDSAALTPAVR